ncbi:MAG TPA: pilin [Verrucomicrobiae bacterium]|nr:pilin [Verrucomicrobiae bacterium]
MKLSIKNAIYAGTAATLSALPAIASAQSVDLNGNPFNRGANAVANVAGKANIGGGTTDLYTIVGRVVNVVLGFLGIVLLFYFIYGGFRWMTAGGDEKQVGEAKTMIRNAVIGLVIIMASYALSSFVLNNLVAVTS